MFLVFQNSKDTSLLFQPFMMAQLILTVELCLKLPRGLMKLIVFFSPNPTLSHVPFNSILKIYEIRHTSSWWYQSCVEKKSTHGKWSNVSNNKQHIHSRDRITSRLLTRMQNYKVWKRSFIKLIVKFVSVLLVILR